MDNIEEKEDSFTKILNYFTLKLYSFYSSLSSNFTSLILKKSLMLALLLLFIFESIITFLFITFNLNSFYYTKPEEYEVIKDFVITVKDFASFYTSMDIKKTNILIIMIFIVNLIQAIYILTHRYLKQLYCVKHICIIIDYLHIIKINLIDNFLTLPFFIILFSVLQCSDNKDLFALLVHNNINSNGEVLSEKESYQLSFLYNNVINLEKIVTLDTINYNSFYINYAYNNNSFSKYYANFPFDFKDNYKIHSINQCTDYSLVTTLTVFTIILMIILKILDIIFMKEDTPSYYSIQTNFSVHHGILYFILKIILAITFCFQNSTITYLHIKVLLVLILIIIIISYKIKNLSYGNKKLFDLETFFEGAYLVACIVNMFVFYLNITVTYTFLFLIFIISIISGCLLVLFIKKKQERLFFLSNSKLTEEEVIDKTRLIISYANEFFISRSARSSLISKIRNEILTKHVNNCRCYNFLEILLQINYLSPSDFVDLKSGKFMYHLDFNSCFDIKNIYNLYKNEEDSRKYMSEESKSLYDSSVNEESEQEILEESGNNSNVVISRRSSLKNNNNINLNNHQRNASSHKSIKSIKSYFGSYFNNNESNNDNSDNKKIHSNSNSKQTSGKFINNTFANHGNIGVTDTNKTSSIVNEKYNKKYNSQNNIFDTNSMNILESRKRRESKQISKNNLSIIESKREFNENSNKISSSNILKRNAEGQSYIKNNDIEDYNNETSNLNNDKHCPNNIYHRKIQEIIEEESLKINSDEVFSEKYNTEQIFNLALYSIILCYLKDFKLRYPKNAILSLQFSKICLFHLNNYHLSIFELLKIKSDNLRIKYFIHKHYQSIMSSVKEDYTITKEKENNQDTPTFNCDSVLKYYTLIDSLEKQIKECSEETIKFWNIILDKNKDQYFKTFLLSKRVNDLITNIKAIFDNLLNQYEMNNLAIIRYFIGFWSFVVSDSQANSKIKLMLTKIKNSNNFFSLKNDENSLSKIDNIGVILVGSSLNSMCKIEYVNSYALNTVKHESKEIINCNLRVLLPEYIAEFHDNFVKRYIETNRVTILNKTILMFIKAKQGYVVPVNVHVKKVHSITNSIKFISTIKRMKQPYGLVTPELNYSMELFNTVGNDSSCATGNIFNNNNNIIINSNNTNSTNNINNNNMQGSSYYFNVNNTINNTLTILNNNNTSNTNNNTSTSNNIINLNKTPTINVTNKNAFHKTSTYNSISNNNIGNNNVSNYYTNVSNIRSSNMSNFYFNYKTTDNSFLEKSKETSPIENSDYVHILNNHKTVNSSMNNNNMITNNFVSSNNLNNNMKINNLSSNNSNFIYKSSKSVCLILTTGPPEYYLIGLNKAAIAQFGIPLTSKYNRNTNNKHLLKITDLLQDLVKSSKIIKEENNITSMNNTNASFINTPANNNNNQISNANILNNNNDNNCNTINNTSSSSNNLFDLININPNEIKYNDGIISLLNSTCLYSLFHDYVETVSEDNAGFYDLIHDSIKKQLHMKHIVHLSYFNIPYNNNRSNFCVFRIVKVHPYQIKNKIMGYLKTKPSFNLKRSLSPNSVVKGTPNQVVTIVNSNNSNDNNSHTRNLTESSININNYTNEISTDTNITKYIQNYCNSSGNEMNDNQEKYDTEYNTEDEEVDEHSSSIKKNTVLEQQVSDYLVKINKEKEIKQNQDFFQLAEFNITLFRNSFYLYAILILCFIISISLRNLYLNRSLGFYEIKKMFLKRQQKYSLLINSINILYYHDNRWLYIDNNLNRTLLVDDMLDLISLDTEIEYEINKNMNIINYNMSLFSFVTYDLEKSFAMKTYPLIKALGAINNITIDGDLIGDYDFSNINNITLSDEEDRILELDKIISLRKYINKFNMNAKRKGKPSIIANHYATSNKSLELPRENNNNSTNSLDEINNDLIINNSTFNNYIEDTNKNSNVNSNLEEKSQIDKIHSNPINNNTSNNEIKQIKNTHYFEQINTDTIVIKNKHYFNPFSIPNLQQSYAPHNLINKKSRKLQETTLPSEESDEEEDSYIQYPFPETTTTPALTDQDFLVQSGFFIKYSKNSFDHILKCTKIKISKLLRELESLNLFYLLEEIRNVDPTIEFNAIDSFLSNEQIIFSYHFINENYMLAIMKTFSKSNEYLVTDLLYDNYYHKTILAFEILPFLIIIILLVHLFYIIGRVFISKKKYLVIFLMTDKNLIKTIIEECYLFSKSLETSKKPNTIFDIKANENVLFNNIAAIKVDKIINTHDNTKELSNNYLNYNTNLTTQYSQLDTQQSNTPMIRKKTFNQNDNFNYNESNKNDVIENNEDIGNTKSKKFKRKKTKVYSNMNKKNIIFSYNTVKPSNNKLSYTSNHNNLSFNDPVSSKNNSYYKNRRGSQYSKNSSNISYQNNSMNINQDVHRDKQKSHILRNIDKDKDSTGNFYNSAATNNRLSSKLKEEYNNLKEIRNDYNEQDSKYKEIQNQSSVNNTINNTNLENMRSNNNLLESKNKINKEHGFYLDLLNKNSKKDSDKINSNAIHNIHIIRETDNNDYYEQTERDNKTHGNMELDKKNNKERLETDDFRILATDNSNLIINNDQNNNSFHRNIAILHTNESHFHSKNESSITNKVLDQEEDYLNNNDVSMYTSNFVYNHSNRDRHKSDSYSKQHKNSENNNSNKSSIIRSSTIYNKELSLNLKPRKKPNKILKSSGSKKDSLNIEKLKKTKTSNYSENKNIQNIKDNIHIENESNRKELLNIYKDSKDSKKSVKANSNCNNNSNNNENFESLNLNNPNSKHIIDNQGNKLSAREKEQLHLDQVEENFYNVYNELTNDSIDNTYTLKSLNPIIYKVIVLLFFGLLFFAIQIILERKFYFSKKDIKVVAITIRLWAINNYFYSTSYLLSHEFIGNCTFRDNAELTSFKDYYELHKYMTSDYTKIDPHDLYLSNDTVDYTEAYCNTYSYFYNQVYNIESNILLMNNENKIINEYLDLNNKFDDSTIFCDLLGNNTRYTSDELIQQQNFIADCEEFFGGKKSVLGLKDQIQLVWKYFQMNFNSSISNTTLSEEESSFISYTDTNETSDSDFLISNSNTNKFNLNDPVFRKLFFLLKNYINPSLTLLFKLAYTSLINLAHDDINDNTILIVCFVILVLIESVFIYIIIEEFKRNVKNDEAFINMLPSQEKNSSKLYFLFNGNTN